MLTQTFLKSILAYDKDTGVFTWIIDARNNAKKGTVAGYKHHSGYSYIGIKGRGYASHRLVWLYVKGCLPEIIDHINGDKSDNRAVNLRIATVFENNRNANIRKDNTSGAKGVTFDKETGKWRVSVFVNKVRLNFGRHSDFELAALIAEEARIKYHGDFARV